MHNNAIIINRVPQVANSSYITVKVAKQACL